ncbi:uncharacterized protein LOC123192720 isoform X2 [Mangifera indica]|nr:uncharacterized protein LOC123192720 isoform X2 [Mangifera indica]
MEERKLNFNAPLLSVRRFSTSLSSSDGKHGKMIKDSQPNRRHTIPLYKADLSLEQVTEPVAVPFLWEQTPGQPKDGGPQHQQLKDDILKYPLEKEVDRPNTELCCLIDRLISYDCLKKGYVGKENLNLEYDDDVDSDAVSQTDSISMNCSVSGVSGSDCQVIKPSGAFSMDQQTRDFMMSRFLPAAMAMALDQPQYASRRQLVSVKQPRQVIKVDTKDRKPLVNKSIVTTHYGEDGVREDRVHWDEEESEDEVDEYDESVNLSSRGCGLFPGLCLNKSLCLLNPIPGVKVRTHSSMSSTSEVRQSGKSTLSFFRHQSDCGVQSPKLIPGIENKMTNESSRFTCSNEQQMSNRSSPYRRGISPYRNERPQSPFTGVGFLGIPKEAEHIRATNILNFHNKACSKSQELLPYQSSKRGSGSLSPAVEKTLYVDTVSFAKIACSNSISSDTKGQVDPVTSMGSRGIEEIASTESSLQGVKCLNIARGGSILEAKIGDCTEAKIGDCTKANQSSFSKILHPRGPADVVECFGPDGELNQECKSLELVKVADYGNLNCSKGQYLEKDDSGCFNSGFEQSPLPPPLPQKPSESWLWRTLPSVSSQNSFSPSYSSRFHPKRQDSNISTKCETIVKTSYSHNNHKRYSEPTLRSNRNMKCEDPHKSPWTT